MGVVEGGRGWVEEEKALTYLCAIWFGLPTCQVELLKGRQKQREEGRAAPGGDTFTYLSCNWWPKGGESEPSILLAFVLLHKF